MKFFLARVREWQKQPNAPQKKVKQNRFIFFGKEIFHKNAKFQALKGRHLIG
jgi:hypothetical protein